MSTWDTMRETALELARHGIPVGKLTAYKCRPFAGSHGAYDATVDLEVIEGWTGQYCLFAHLGPVNMTAIDFDSDDDYQHMITTYPELRDTITYYSASGNRHVWIRGSYKNIVRYHDMKIDLKSLGGFVIVPPSVREKNGIVKTYRWISGYRPFDREAVEPSAALKQFLRDAIPSRAATTTGKTDNPASSQMPTIEEVPVEYKREAKMQDINTAVGLMKHYAGKASDGTRNSTMWTLACQLRDNDVPIRIALYEAHEYCQRVNKHTADQYTTDEAVRQVIGAYTTPRREPARKQP